MDIVTTTAQVLISEFNWTFFKYLSIEYLNKKFLICDIVFLRISIFIFE